MTAAGKPLAGADGPRLWANWQAKRSGAPLRGIVELKLFTDAWIIAEATHGPYIFLNTVPHTVRGERFGLTPSIALRVEHYLAPDLSDMSVTSDDHYHGGWLYDEVAALAALVLGARIVAGPVDREFGYNLDPLGQPRAQALALLPALPTRTEAPQIPWLFEDRDLRNLALFETIADLDSAAAVTLIKSARLFQQALWVCDTTPETAWLLLVSAVETAAAHWNASTMSPVERLTRSYPKLVALLEAKDSADLFEGVAAELSPLIAATGKFLGFCTTYRPEAPEHRARFGRMDFEPAPFKAAMTKIYQYRSRALHGGIPFPYPMCMPPDREDGMEGIAEERPGGLGAGARGATWVADDLPMYLHTFAYIARHAILAWWRTLIERTGENETAKR